MLTRAFIVLVTLFWVAMNFLLWQREFGADSRRVSRVPPETVLEKILTSPDNSMLEIKRQGERIGFARWSANIGEDLASGRRLASDREILGGMVEQLSRYTLDCDGSMSVGESTNRFRFYFSMEFDTNFNWQVFFIRISQRPNSWEVTADAERKTVMLGMKQGESTLQEVFSFDEVRNPSALLSRFGMPYAGDLMSQAFAGLGAPAPRGDNFVAQVAGAVQVQGYNDFLDLRSGQVRVHRLKVRIFEAYEIDLIISRVGELFKAELPFGLELLNDELRL